MKSKAQRANIHIYQIHKRNMSNITYRIDNDAPLLPIENVTLTGKAKHDASRFKKMTIENRTLLNHIVQMYRTKGIVDSFNENAGLRVSKLQKDIDAKKRHDIENLELFMKLMRIQPTYDTKNLLCAWESHSLKDIRHACKRSVVLKDLLPKLKRYHEIPLSSALETCTCVQTLLIYVKFKLGGNPIGRIIFRVFKDAAPNCTEIFLECLKLVSGSSGEKTSKDRSLKQKSIDIQWIFPGTYMRFKHPEFTHSSDFVNGEHIHHNCYGIGTLAAIIAPDKSLHFVVTFKQTHPLSENYKIFGQVVHGFDVLDHIEYFGHQFTGHPTEALSIYETGYIFE